MFKFLANIGNKVVRNGVGFIESMRFTGRILRAVFSFRAYNIASVQVLVRQVYFTSVQILPFFLLLSAIVGSVLIGVIMSGAIQFNMLSKIGTVIVHVVFNEVAPFITVLLLALRSGTAMTAEMAVMRVSGQTKTLDYFNVDPFYYLYVPRILNGIISMLFLSTMFIIVALVFGYIFMGLVLHMGWSLYIFTIVNAFTGKALLVLVVKSVLFGYVIAAVPIYRGSKSMLSYNAIPIAVLQGSVKLFIAILMIEVLSFVRFI